MAGIAEPATAAAAEDPMLPRRGRVRARKRELDGVVTLEIVPEAGFSAAVAGQFNMLGLPGIGEIPISLSRDPAQGDGLVHTVRAVGPVSAALSRLTPGDTVWLRGPFGVGWPLAELAGRDVVVVSGGLGLAPLRPVLHRLLAERARYGQIVLLHGARSPAEILYRREIAAWRHRLDIDIAITLDHAGADWRGHVGVVTHLIPQAAFDPHHATALVCGPEVMMRFAIAALGAAGLATSAIFLSLERNMQCAVGLCGHCQFGPFFVCRDGPVFRYDKVAPWLSVKEM
jgi:NAD(P)H-flavin reductase|uniref:Ni/Fe hydrogenase subunit gamma n=1 Tax=Acidicaldus sp. TaxID=1872105 RepID=A0A8J4HFQ6_9PROT